MAKRISLFLLILALATAALAADRKAAVDKLVQPVVDNEYAVGVVVGVLEDGKTQVFGYGRRSAADPKAPDAATVFEIGSVTKVFTALTLAGMIEKKQVALTDPVSKYLPAGTLPAVPEGATEITLLDLVTHTSGLPRMPNNFKPKDPTNPYADYSPELLYEFLAKQTLVKKPDSAYLYSNVGMGLLGHLLTLKAGMPYEKLVVSSICGPLGMRDTRVMLSDDMKSRLAHGHNADGDPVANWDLNALAGAGAIRSTAADMLRFVAANLEPPKPLAAAIQLSHEVRAKTTTPTGSIAMAWHIKPNGVYWHNGGTGGYTTYISFRPERKTGVVVLINTSGTLMNDIGAKMEGMLAGETIELLKFRTSVKLDAKTLDSYSGTYELAPGVQLKLRRDGDKMIGQLSGQQEVRLYAEAPDKFFLKLVDAQLAFNRDDQGNVTSAVLHQNGRDIPLKRVP